MAADERLALAFLADHPTEAARVLEQASPADAAALLTSIPADARARVYRALGPTPAVACAALLPDDVLASIVQALPLDAAALAMRRVEPSRRDAVLAGVEEDRGSDLRTMLGYADDTAGAIADPLAQSLAEDITVADAQRRLRGSRMHLLSDVYIVSRDGVLVGVLSLPGLMAASTKAALADVMQRQLVRIDALANLATVVVHPAWRDHDALPVVDSAGRLIGAIRHQTIRQLDWDSGRPVMATIVGLSELYWAGLSGIVASLTAAPAVQEDNHVT